MMMQLAEELGEIKRQVANLLQIGTVISSSDDSRYFKIKIGGIEKDLPQLSAQPKSRTPLPDDSRVLLICPHGDLENALILGAISRPEDAEDTKDFFHVIPGGGSIRYDAEGNVTINIGSGKKLTVTGGSEVVIKGAITLDGNTTVQGKLTAEGEVTGQDLKTSSGVSLENHTHSESNGQAGTSPPKKGGV